MNRILVPGLLGLLGLCVLARADVGVYTGNGQDLRQITSSSIQLVSIDVTILPERGRFLFDGGVPGMDRVEYLCTFVLRNLTDEAAEVQVGFPIDSQFAAPPYEPTQKQDSWTWVKEYGFIARDEKTTYHIELVQRESTEDDKSRATFSWKMSFAPKETRELHVHYRMAMSMSLANTRKPEAKREDFTASGWRRFLEAGLVEYAGYITETGSSWAGNVEKAKFTVATVPFERYLTRRGMVELADDLGPEEVAKMRRVMPVQECWWYRKMTPAGARPAGEFAMSWEYSDFKPKDAITMAWFLTQFPRTEEAVGPFVDAIVTSMDEEERGKPGEVLAAVRDVLLATWGQEPTNAIALAFVQEQNWYEPRTGFTLEALTPRQQAVLSAFDAKVSSVVGGK